MPTIRLNDRTLAALKGRVGRQTDYFDRALPGFGVRIGAGGRKTFILCYRTPGRRTMRRQSLGTYPLKSLATARQEAQEGLRKTDVGRDPAAEQKTAKAQTFDALAALYLERHAKRKKRSWPADARMIRKELAGWTGRPVKAIRRRHVREILDGIVDRGAPILANRVLSLISKIFNFGLRDLDDENWLEANVAAKMAKPAAEQSRSRVLSEAELRATWKHLEQPAPKALDAVDRRRWELARAALKLRLITAQRGKEVLSLRGRDLDGAWWTIPADVAKNKLPHRVYLSKSALAIVKGLRAEQPDDDAYLFAGIRGASKRRGTLDGLDVQDVRPHDFRRTAATVMASGGVPRLVVSMILNHVDNSITAVYDRASYDLDKQSALTWWATKLESVIKGKRSTVLPFQRSA